MSEYIDRRLDRLEVKLDQVLQQIEQLMQNLDSTKQSCAHMDDHIEFVESVYESVRHPLSYITNKFSAKQGELPAIK